jgi:hypothetical protein
MYLNAVADGFGEDIDYAMLVKVYGNDSRRRDALQPCNLHGPQA